MIILLDTSTAVCRLTLVENDERKEFEWQADRQLARSLLKWLSDQLASQGKAWRDITGIGAFLGPGSFTGLRIGLTVLNTLADSLSVPIVGATGDAWQGKALERLVSDENDQIILPYYGSDAKITTQRK
ncbi:MAG: tRNA (adenosine(37)-N6)-threonylcarbamoyltransferase complex dimerization subunit type 1 TsaB [Candidatus Nomurabacteria bacterium]|nr:MAG: tRNA (adenosine(37)-N6)-threonylcarbamoyltransferase complex dimerization subunit type 1 TsaB [Candidatus Nomurabacteria bacterium]